MQHVRSVDLLVHLGHLAPQRDGARFLKERAPPRRGRRYDGELRIRDRLLELAGTLRGERASGSPRISRVDAVVRGGRSRWSTSAVTRSAVRMFLAVQVGGRFRVEQQ
jgi:hypothetical protein